MSDNDTGDSDRETCDIRGCINESFNHGYCEDCLNEMGHYALDLAGVP